MRHSIRPLLGLAAALCVATGSIHAQGKSEDRPNAARGAAAGPDENIDAASGSNVRDAAALAAPASKAAPGTASRGSSDCQVHFDNRSTLYISTYADGTYRGSLGPWGDVYSYVIAGPTRLYARATFSDGSVTTWGPRMVDCPPGGSYQWLLYQ